MAGSELSLEEVKQLPIKVKVHLAVAKDLTSS